MGKISNASRGKIAIYRTKDKKVKLEVRLQQETVWLTQKQVGRLFRVNRSVITKHINNIFKSEELEEKSYVQKMHIAFCLFLYRFVSPLKEEGDL